MSTAIQETDPSIPPPPVFGMVAPVANKTQNGNILSLDDIFDDFMYKKNQAADGSAHGADASGSGKTSSKDGDEDDDDLSGSDDDDAVGKKRKTIRGTSRSMTEEQKIERR